MPGKMKLSFYLGLLVLSISAYGAASTQSQATFPGTSDDVVVVEAAWSVDRVRPGDSLLLAIVADIKKGYHINADERQARSLADFRPYPTAVTVTGVSPGAVIGTPHYPKAVPMKVQYATGYLMSFEGQTVIYLPIKLGQSVEQGVLELKLAFEYQACASDYCLFPKKIELSESLPVAEAGTAVSTIREDLFAGYAIGTTAPVSPGVDFDFFGWRFSVDASSVLGRILVLLIAALGGMLLNLTPCVLPLIPIKIISLSHVAGSRRKCVLLGTAMSLGVLAFWMVLGAMIALVSGFSATNQLFQYPAFTILVGLIIGAMATGMFGSFSMRLPRFIYGISPKQDTLHGSFGLGVLAAILSTPCTAPFMGAAAAWASIQAPETTLAVFAAVGTGMALPYLVLAANPSLVGKMPKTGPAGELIKQVMGLFMLAAAAYFAGVGLSALLSDPAGPPSKTYWWVVMAFIIAGGGWLAYRTLQISPDRGIKAAFTGIGVFLVVLSTWGAVRLTDPGPVDWVYYTPQRFESAVGDRKLIVMVFTAEWCLNCKVLEQGVLSDPQIAALFAREDLVPMKVDITGSNPAGRAKLREAGNLTIPLLVIFSPRGERVFKSDFYTVDQVHSAVTNALRNSVP